MNASCTRAERAGYVAATVLILGLGAAFHFVKLATLPHGLFHDEAYNLLDEATVSWGHTPVFFTANEGREALYFYWQHLFVVALGASTFAARLPSAFLSVVEVALQVAVMGRLFGRRVGLLSGVVMATLYEFVQDGRLGLRFTSLPIIVLLTIVALWSAVRGGRMRPFVWLGVVLGLGAYTYVAARMLPVVAALFGAYAVAVQPRRWRLWLAGISLAAAISAVIVAPLALAVFHQSGGTARLGQTSVVRADRTLSQNAQAVLANAVTYSKSYSVLGDVQWLSNIRGRPVFEPVMGAWFYAGLAILVLGAAARRDASVLCLILLVAMYVPGVLTTEAPYFQRVYGTIPVAALAPALAMDLLWRRAAGITWRWAAVLAVILSLATQTLSTARDYFAVYAHARESAFDLGSGATAIAEFLAARRPVGDLYISTYDDVVPKALAPAQAAPAHWFHARELLPLPINPARAAYYFFDFTDPSPVEASLRSVATPVMAAVDRNVGIEVAHGYRVEVGRSLAALLPSSPRGTFGAAMTITGARIEQPGASPGEIDVLLGLQAERDSPGYLSVSVRALDGAGNVWGSRDGIGADLSQWKAGQAALSLHPLRLPAGTPAGTLKIVASIYQLSTLQPLALESGGTQLTLGTATLDRATPLSDDVALPPHHMLDLSLGRTVRIVGTEPVAPSPKQGDLWRLGVLWRCVQPGPPGTRLNVEIVGDQGAVLGTLEPGGGLAAPPPSGCLPGATIVDRRVARVGARWPAGPAYARAILLDAAGNQVDGQTLVRLNIVPLARQTTIPRVAVPLGVRFADGVALVGASAERGSGGADTSVRLVWRSIGEPQQDRTVFVHLIGPNGNLIAQHDSPPAGGAWPLTAWMGGQVVIDDHPLSAVSAGAPAGSYLEVGLYDPASGGRLVVTEPGSADVRDNAVRIPWSSLAR